MSLYHFFRPLFFTLAPENAHSTAIRALKMGLLPSVTAHAEPMLQQAVCGLTWQNPVGLAPGFDKNAEVITSLLTLGFGGVEAGTVTPKPQDGNDKPRLFRLTEDRAIINRMGFNNHGIDAYRTNLERAFTAPQKRGIIGANVGKNKDSANDASDYSTCIQQVYAYCDYITINISSPNTPGLRDIQGDDYLVGFLADIQNCAQNCAEQHGIERPIFLKIAPDMDVNTLKTVLDTVMAAKIDGLIVSNTTLSREGLHSKHQHEAGGLSGVPLQTMAREMIRTCYQHTGGQLPIIGVGGINSAASAYAAIRAGASIVQLYSALIYEGFGLVQDINCGLIERLKQDGFATISDAIGADAA